MFPILPQDRQYPIHKTDLPINEIKHQITTVLKIKILKRVHGQNLVLVFYEETLFQIFVTTTYVGICLK